MERQAPWWLSHKPVITVDYENKDGMAGDAKYMSIGHATWNSEDFSAKIWRWTEKGNKWSRQSEEIPLWRVLDLATLLAAVINKRQSNLEEFIQDSDSVEALREFLNDNMELYASRLQELRKMLEYTEPSPANKNIPNIFSFATSELSQDAMFAWILKWADPAFKNEDIALHHVACSFLKLLLGENDFECNSIEVGRQWQNIDVWAEINENAFLVIEDKTNTSIHSDQLDRYKTIVEKEYSGKRDQLFFVYIKTGNEPISRLKEIEKKGYRTVSRIDIINCLKDYQGNNTLVMYYVNHLKEIEIATQSFKSSPVSEWGWYAWQGFYKELESRLNISSWDYVANPAGGFLGAWWYFKPVEGIEMYLQFEEKKLCFKIYCEEGDQSAIREKMYQKLISTAKERNHPEISKPIRFRAGRYMTIAVVDPDYLFGNSLIDIDSLVEKLKTYQSLIDECCMC